MQAYASGRVSPNFHGLRMLKKKFGLDYDWLIDGKTKTPAAWPLAGKLKKAKDLLLELDA